MQPTLKLAALLTGLAVVGCTAESTVAPRSATVLRKLGANRQVIIDSTHRYELVTVPGGIMWNAARDSAVARGGHLVTITSAAENDYLVKEFNDDLDAFAWIGASDADAEGVWRWVDGPEKGHLLLYTNWGPVEPNNYLRNEHFAVLNLGPLSAGGTANGQWGDTHAEARIPGFIVEYPDSTRIKEATLDFAWRLEARDAQLQDVRSRVRALLGRREALEVQIVEASDRAERARSESGLLSAERAKLEATKQQLLAFLERWRAALGETARMEEIKRQIVYVKASIRHLEEQIAKRKGDVTALQRRLEGQRRALESLEVMLYEEVRADPKGREFVLRLESLHRDIRSLRQRENAVTAALQSAEAEIRAALQSRLEIDATLSELATRLAELDASLRTITVQAADVTVFKATAEVPFAEVHELNSRIAESARHLAELDAERLAAQNNFYLAKREAIASGERVADVIMKVAYLNAGVEGVSHLVDLSDAAAKGGLAGVVLEGARKLAEQQIDKAMKGDPTPEDVALRAMYEKFLDESAIQSSVEDFAAETAIGEGLTVAKDEFSKVAGLLYDKLGLPRPVTRWADYRERKTLRDPPRFASAVRQLRQVRQQVDALNEGYQFELKDFGKALLKDGIKKVFTDWLEQAEEAALCDFVENEVMARFYYAVKQTASHYYWQAYDAHESLLETKAALLDGLSGETGLRTEISLPFSRTATLRVLIDVTADDPINPPFAVLVGDVPATPMPQPNVFEVSVQRSRLASDGSVSLVVR